MNVPVDLLDLCTQNNESYKTKNTSDSGELVLFFSLKKLIDNIDDFKMELCVVPCQACSLLRAFTRSQYGVFPPHCLGLVLI